MKHFGKHSYSALIWATVAMMTLLMSLPAWADQYRSIGTGSWSLTGTWNKSTDGGATFGATATVPGNAATDTVLVRNAHTVTINTNFTIAKLTVGEGTSGILAYDGTARTTVITGNVIVAAGGTFRAPSSGSGVTHSLTLGGDVTNSGTITFSSGARFVDLIFNKNGNQTVSGAGTTTLNNITLNMGTSKANTLDMQSVMTMGTLTLTNGTFKLSSASTMTPFSGSVTLGSTTGLFLNNASAVSTWGAAGSLTLNGDLTIANGTMTIGATNNRLEIGATGTYTQSGGTLNVSRLQANTAGGTFTMSGGTFNIPAGGAVNTASNSIFEMTAATFSMSNGTVSIASPNANTTLPDVNINRSGTPITGGTFVITTGAAINTITVSSNVPFYNFTVQNGAAAVTARLRTNTLKVTNNLTIASGTLDAATNTINMEIGGNWSNAGTFQPGTNTVTLNGSGSQTMSGSTFYNLTINNAAGVTLLTNENVSHTLTLSNGLVTTGVDTMIIGSAGNVSRTSGHIVGNLQKAFPTGAQSFTFDIGTGSNYLPVVLAFANVTGAGNVTASTTGSEHGSISTSGLNGGKDVNRYWTLGATGGITFTTYAATFTFVNPGDLDGGANTSKFLVRRYNGSSWSPTTTGTRTSTTTQATGISGMSDFAIGEQEIDHYAVSASTPQTAGATFTTSVTAQDFINETVAEDNSTVVTMTGTGSTEFDSDGNATFGDNTKTLTAGTFTISTKDTVAETINITATDGNAKTGTQAGVVVNPAAAAKLAFVQEPTDATAGVALSPSVTVQLKDAFGNNVSTSGVSIDMTLSSGTGTLGGTTTQVTNGSGLASFGDLSVNLAGSKNLTAASTGLTSAISTAFTISAAAASQLVFVQEPTDAAAGVAISPAVTVQLKDAFGNNVPSSGVSIDMTLSTGTGVLSGTTTQVTNGSGIATFGDLSINLVGSKNLTAASTGLTSAISTAFNITTAAASQLVFVLEPTDATAGVAITPAITVQLKDAFGNNVPSSGVSIDLTLSTGSGTLSGTTTQVTNGSGLATFSGLSINLVGSKNLTAASTGLTSAISTAFTISPAAASQLVFVQEPTDATAGVAIAPAITVQLKDAFGNNVPSSGVSVDMTLSTGTGVLSGTTTQVTNGSGLATFGDLSINLVGSKNLTAASTGLSSAISTAFTISAAAASQLVFAQEPTDASAGVAIAPAITVQLKDAFGNNVPSSGVSIDMTLSTGTGVLSGTTTQVTNGSGLASFGDLSINLSGSKNLTAASTGLTSAISSAFTISAAAASQLVFVQEPTDATAGVAISPAITVQLKDAFGNNVSSSGVSIDMTLSTGTGVLGGTTTQVTNGSGLASFGDLSINISGSKNLTAASTGLTSAISSAFTISAAAASQLVFIQEPTDATAGVAISPAVTVQLRDAFGNNVPSSGVSIGVTLSSGTGTLGGTAAQLTNGSGLATFSDLSVNLVGSKNLTAASTGLTSAISAAFTISAAAASQLVFVQEPTDAVAGVIIAPAVTVQLRDSFGNDVASSGVSVAITLSTGTGTLSGTTPQLTNGLGVATFGDLSIQLSGSKNLTASSSGLASAISAAFTISPATGSGKVVFVQQPTTTTAGVVISPAVTAQLQDNFGNNVPTSGVSIVVTMSSGTGTLSGTTTQLTNGSGLATFGNLSVNLAGSKNLTAASTGLTSAVSTAFTINPAAASQLLIVQQPTNATAGVTISPAVTVQLKDPFGNNVPTASVSVAMTLSTGTGALSGTTSQSTNASGLATFGDLSINLAGSKNLTAASTGLTSAISSAFTISAAAAHQLVFVQQPSAAAAGIAISPAVTVELKDAFGNVVSSAGVSVTMTLSTGTGSLNGTTAQLTNGSGLASFGDLSIDLVGSKALTASSAGLVSAISSTFTIFEAIYTLTEKEGWNMLSVPLYVADYSKTSLYPSATTVAFTYQGSYKERDTLRIGSGYWLKFGAPDTFDLDGSVIGTFGDSVKTGWNMIGAISKPVAVSDLVESPSGIVLSNYFGYDDAYQIADSLRPGKAYWVRVSGDGVITLASSGIAPTMNKRTPELLSSLNSITFTDARGRSQVLYFGTAAQSSEPLFELPPMPPAGAFDVRYASQSMAATFEPVRSSTEEYPMSISSAVYPVTVTWDIVSPSRGTFLMVNGKRLSLRSNGSLHLASAPAQMILKVLSSSELPTEFTVDQNYPNPFNPRTSIRFGVPEDARVTLKLFNALGQEVQSPLNGEEMEAGFHSVEIDGNQLASGVYFYRLEAHELRDASQSFVQIRKMALIK